MRIAFGIMGGWNQAQAHAQFVSNVVDFGMNIQAALEARASPRERSPAATWTSRTAIPAGVRDALTALGHQLACAAATRTPWAAARP